MDRRGDACPDKWILGGRSGAEGGVALAARIVRSHLPRRGPVPLARRKRASRAVVLRRAGDAGAAIRARTRARRESVEIHGVSHGDGGDAAFQFSVRTQRKGSNPNSLHRAGSGRCHSSARGGGAVAELLATAEII